MVNKYQKRHNSNLLWRFYVQTIFSKISVFDYTTEFLKIPIPSTSNSTTSPGSRGR
ncbi:hypothetical protein EMA8858_00933 [Emticicia aquatica]|uniref:Uncharacterized protein n=1 Tax=Emticicia aquatica TaxID=1681835 RepID=A0ABN8ESB1_9BACT|nr:hypothetical protein EMA8858_00933 [Emticicia aquatica]